MELLRCPPQRQAVERFVEELWIPYHDLLADSITDHALADEIDLVAAEADYRLESLERDGYEHWIAVEGVDGTGDLTSDDVDLLGFVTMEIDRAPIVFERPDRVTVGDLFVVPACWGSGLADALMARVRTFAEDAGCAEVSLEVDVDNARARAYYERLGFDPHRLSMVAGTGSLPR